MLLLGQPVLISDGSKKLIDHIYPGDMLKSDEGVVAVVHTWIGYVYPTVKLLLTSGDELYVAPTVRFRREDGAKQHVIDTAPGDRLSGPEDVFEVADIAHLGVSGYVKGLKAVGAGLYLCAWPLWLKLKRN